MRLGTFDSIDIMCPFSNTVPSYLFFDETKTCDFTYLMCQVFLMEVVLQELGSKVEKWPLELYS